ncbi:ABC transporter substrate-binding protein [Hydrogenophaga sp. YM1]|uniref:ABC transporter substrate-binding protein n=1 Tax=Hydrogenophaga sp. YM1 TaxID=2806262 RepID=UPI00195AE082|nr:ABC transporter substrate-binding protein [Hydrogenophaga sp. YM1]QRR35601.1 ABC transporter substrate-binding protein [Hydrogenophaga sp. YM1]
MFQGLFPRLLSVGLLASIGATAGAQVKVGVIVSATGPAASIGIPERRVVDLMPRRIGDKTIEYIVMDDATDTNQAVKAARKLMADDKVDVLIGPSASAPSIAVVNVAAELSTPMVSMASSSRIVSPVDDKRKWAFKVVMDESAMVETTLKHLSETNKRKLAFIGSGDAYGDVWLAEVNRLRGKYGVELVGTERFASSDVTVLAQVAKVMATSPDAVLIAAGGTPAALPHKTLRERQYKGLIVQTYGASVPEVLKIGGKDMAGTIAANWLGFVPEQMDRDDPVRLATEELNKKYEAAYGAGSWSPSAVNAWTAWQLLQNALPEVLKTQQPGTPAFRSALRDHLEKTKNLSTAMGIISMSPQDHMGFDLRSTTVFELRDGSWTRIAK